MTAKPQVRTSRGTKVTELFANESAWLVPRSQRARESNDYIIPVPENHLAAGTELFVAFGKEGDRGGVGLGGVCLGRGDHAVLVAH